MTDPVGRCPVHGVREGERCDCGRETERVLGGERRERLSKFLSGLLRHFPEEYDVELDAAGWANRGTVGRVAAERYPWADADRVAPMVATDPKGRFETRDGEIRAAYGHSVDVDLDAETGADAVGAAAEAVPDRLYHGTSPGVVEAILREGLRPMGRREVHLSLDVETAREVGRRHADEAAVLAVDAAGMLADGRRVSRRGPETYTADRVPPAYLERVE